MLSLLLHPQLLFVAILRPLGICIIFPILATRNLGSSLIRNALILAFAMPVLQLYIENNPQIVISDLNLTFIFQEIFIGLIIGFAAALPFWALDSAGFIIDTIRGSSMGSVLNPSLGEAASVLGILFVQLFIALFFMYGGLNHVLSSLYQSYRIIPPSTHFNLDMAWLKLFLAQWQTMFSLSISFVMPAVVVMVLTDLAIGLMNRSAQQLNVFFLAMPIKSVMALLMLIMSMLYAFQIYFAHLDGLPGQLEQLMEKMIL